MKCTAYQEIILWNVECSTSIVCVYILMRPKHDTWEWPEIILKEGKETQHKEGFFCHNRNIWQTVHLLHGSQTLHRLLQRRAKGEAQSFIWQPRQWFCLRIVWMRAAVGSWGVRAVGGPVSPSTNYPGGCVQSILSRGRVRARLLQLFCPNRGCPRPSGLMLPLRLVPQAFCQISTYWFISPGIWISSLNHYFRGQLTVVYSAGKNVLKLWDVFTRTALFWKETK